MLLNRNMSFQWNPNKSHETPSMVDILSIPIISLGVFFVLLISIAYTIDKHSVKKRNINKIRGFNQICIPIQKDKYSNRPKSENSQILSDKSILITPNQVKLIRVKKEHFFCLNCGEELTQESIQIYNTLPISLNQVTSKPKMEEYFYCIYCGEKLTLESIQALNLKSITRHQETSKSEIVEHFYCIYCGEKLDKKSDLCPVCDTKIGNLHKLQNLNHIS